MTDVSYVNRAVELAKEGFGRTRTNPLVGACLVDGDRVLAEGYHEVFGGNHAEENLLSELGEIPNGCTLYLTLEPCVKHGKTPPCLDRLAESGIEDYVILCLDPNRSVNGAGVDALRNLGFSVELLDGSPEYHWMNRHYFYGVRTGMPWIDLKLAMSADGYIATTTGSSRWITGEKSRNHGHRLRSRVDAVMVGAGTLRSDDPRLTDRVTDRTDQPDAIVVARSSEGFRLSCHLFEERPEETILVVPPGFDSELADELENRGVTLLRADLYDGSFRWHQVLPRLRRKDIGRILVEGGSMLAGSLLESSVVNEGHCFYSGKIFGNGIPSVKTGSGVVSVDAVPEGTLMHHRRFGNDLYVNRVFEDSLVGTELESIDFTTFDHSVKPGVD